MSTNNEELLERLICLEENLEKRLEEIIKLIKETKEGK